VIATGADRLLAGNRTIGALNVVSVDAAHPVFELLLWLQKSCCGGELLWACNLDHLSFVESFVAATIRERPDAVRAGDGYRRMSMVDKLPSWLRSAKGATRSSRPFSTSSAASFSAP